MGPWLRPCSVQARTRHRTGNPEAFHKYVPGPRVVGNKYPQSQGSRSPAGGEGLGRVALLPWACFPHLQNGETIPALDHLPPQIYRMVFIISTGHENYPRKRQGGQVQIVICPAGGYDAGTHPPPPPPPGGVCLREESVQGRWPGTCLGPLTCGHFASWLYAQVTSLSGSTTPLAPLSPGQGGWLGF